MSREREMETKIKVYSAIREQTKGDKVMGKKKARAER